MDHAGRRARLAQALADTGVEALLVTRPVNVRYLTGLASSNAALLVPAQGPAVLATDSRYADHAREAAPDVELEVTRDVAGALVRRAAAGGARRVGFEDHHLTVEAYGRLQPVAGDVALAPAQRPVEALRAVKDDDELALLRAAAGIGDATFAALAPTLRPGRSEKDVAAELVALLRAHGADAPAFEPIVAGGAASAEPHHEPTSRPVRAGEFLKLDFGARLGGYHSDMTRTVVVGGPPAGWQRDLYDLVATAQRAGRDALRPGAVGADVDATARAVVEAAGHGAGFGHGLGHGVGLEVHEAPMLVPGSAATLEDRATVTVEPGVYLPGRGGVRIEDTLVVRADGPELLTRTTRDLLVL